MRINPEQGLQFSQMLVQDEEPLADITQVRMKLTVYLNRSYSHCLLSLLIHALVDHTAVVQPLQKTRVC